nr:GntR family transcriptional regulator [Cryobacterium sp. Y82]
MSEPGVRPSGSPYVYTELKRQILNLELAPGERLYEPTLSNKFEVSRTPLREAIKRLISESLLEQQPTGGVVVPMMDAKTIAELYDVRAALEGLTAQEAASKVTEVDIQKMRGIVARNAAMVNFEDEAIILGSSLHHAIMDIADNSWAFKLHNQIASHMERYRRFTNQTQERREAALADHRAICEMVASGNIQQSRDLAFAHVIMARDAALKVISGRTLQG